MALIDVTDILLDPDFADPITCVRAIQGVDSQGIASNYEDTDTVFYGVVTSDTGDILDRFDGGDRVKGNIIIHTMYRLRVGGEEDEQADIVEWQGKRYTVSNVNDYSHFGKGFIAATCEAMSVTG